ncbi:MAG: HAMP domain-containing protein [Treponema sp.]|jgi:adenylate cyclase|nr:HAMP domain-containing protein [Treponema sp.]
MARPDLGTSQEKEPVRPSSRLLPGELLDYGSFDTVTPPTLLDYGSFDTVIPPTKQGLLAKAAQQSPAAPESLLAKATQSPATPRSLLAKATQSPATPRSLLAKAEQQSPVPSDVKAVPSDVKAVPPGAEAVPSDAKAVPSGAEAVPPGAEAVPPGAKAVAFDEEVVALDAKAVPSDAEITPPDAEVVALDEEVVALDEEVVAFDEEAVPFDEEVVALDEEVVALDAKAVTPVAQVVPSDAEITLSDAEAISLDAKAALIASLKAAPKAPPKAPTVKVTPKAAPKAPLAPPKAPAVKVAPKATPVAEKTPEEAAPVQAPAVNIVPTVKISIGAKLITIVIISLVFSMGIITALASVLLSADVRLTAEDNNYSINRRMAAGTENTLKATYSKSVLLLNALPLMPRGESTLSYFFEQNPEIEAILISTDPENPSAGPSLYANTRFFTERAVENAGSSDPSLLITWFIAHDEEQERAQAGELILINASPALRSTDLALFFQWGEQSAACFFATDSLLVNSGTSLSYLINENGDLLAHPNTEVVGHNWREEAFVKTVLESEDRSLQTRFVDYDGAEYMGAFQRISTGNAVMITTTPMRTVLSGITAVTWRNILLTAGILALSSVFILLFSRTLSKPLKALTNAVSQIEEGNYHLDIVRSKNRDEIGVLTASIISMSHGLGNFERFTNKSLARMARTGKLATGGTTKQATMFFSDIRGFTAISEKLKAVEVIGFINDYMERMVKCVILTGGTIDKFIGDAVMAHWGAVESTGSAEEDALNCVKAALMMRAALRSFNRGRGGDSKPIIKIGCGVNSGDVVAGQIGSEERMEYTVIGNAVSFADRTETLNKAFGTDIMISEYTWKLCGNYIIAEEMPTVTEQGEKVRMFAVVNVRDNEEAKEMLVQLATIPKTDIRLCRQCLGPLGPQTVADVRTLLGIPTPDLSTVNVDEEEKKYKVQEPEEKK